MAKLLFPIEFQLPSLVITKVQTISNWVLPTIDLNTEKNALIHFINRNMFYKPISCLPSSFVNLSALPPDDNHKKFVFIIFCCSFLMRNDQKWSTKNWKIHNFFVVIIEWRAERLINELEIYHYIIRPLHFGKLMQKNRLLSFFPMNLVIESLGLC